MSPSLCSFGGSDGLLTVCAYIAQINTPKGASIWYGRVTPHEVDAIVQETIIGGKILPALLRGGMNLCAPGRRTLNDW